jgi:DNA-binding NarL/FixJ family response regulator
VTPTVLIVDDHEDVRARARLLLEAGGLEVLAEAGDIAAAVRAARKVHPDLVLLDVGLPDGDGIDAVGRISAAGVGRPAVILVSSRPESDYGSRVAHSGAWGFIAKADLSVPRILALLEHCP